MMEIQAREIPAQTCQTVDAHGTPLSLDYYILVDELTADGEFACESYGVKIAVAGGGDEGSIRHITSSATRINELVELLSKYEVTPVTLEDVVNDWL
ncbi:MAG: DUF6514 family protein [Oscillospiraceae bacterium]|nr:DUF6514 family protein [Oscillospiraceae bacterium]